MIVGCGSHQIDYKQFKMVPISKRTSRDQPESVAADNVGIILSYHRIADPGLDPWGLRVSPENFENQLSVIRKFGAPVSLRDFVSSYQTGNVPKNAVVITFDDGYSDNFTEALPLLKEFDIPSTIFVSSGFIGKPYFWWDALETIFLRPNRLPRNLTLCLDSGQAEWNLGNAVHYTREQYEKDCISCKWRGEPGSRLRIYHEVYETLWLVPFRRRLEIVSEIVQWAGYDNCDFAVCIPLSTSQIRKFDSEDLITIGAHTVNHLPLDTVNGNERNDEIFDCREKLQGIISKLVDTFAYPHGKYDHESSKLLEKYDFLCACTTEESPVNKRCNPFLLPRFAAANVGGPEFLNWLSECFAGR